MMIVKYLIKGYNYAQMIEQIKGGNFQLVATGCLPALVIEMAT